MGQIQNAILNTLGSVQQMAQLYKLTNAYAEQQTKRSAEAAKAAAEVEAQQKYEDLKKEYEKNQTIDQIKAKIHAEPYSEEENKGYKERYSKFYENDNTYADNESRRNALIAEKGKLTQLINKFQGNFDSSELREWVRRRQWLDDTKDFKYLYASEDQNKPKNKKKGRAQKSPQEQADTNENIAKAKSTIKGGNQ